MRQHKVSENFILLIDDEDYDKVKMFKWHLNGSGSTSHTIVNNQQPQVRLANFIMNDNVNMYDHKDQNIYNNQKGNLRICTKSQNEANKKKQWRLKECSSQYKGVNWLEKNKKWMAKITVNHKQMYLGSFDNEADAALAYNEAAKKYFGEFAYINVIL